MEALPRSVPLPILCGELLSLWLAFTSEKAQGYLMTARRSLAGVKGITLGGAMAAVQGNAQFCPYSFGDFADWQLDNFSPEEAFRWCSRMKLRSSSLSLVATFVIHVVPALANVGIDSVLLASGETLGLQQLVVETLHFRAVKSHTLSFYPTGELEAVEGGQRSPRCRLNVVRFAETGKVLDISGGQFIGCMNPRLYADMHQLEEALLPQGGPMRRVTKTRDEVREWVEGVDERFLLMYRFRYHVLSPRELAFSVAQRCWASKHDYCHKCFGRCESQHWDCPHGCGDVKYCSPMCQGIHWPAHSADCNRGDV